MITFKLKMITMKDGKNDYNEKLLKSRVVSPSVSLHPTGHICQPFSGGWPLFCLQH